MSFLPSTPVNSVTLEGRICLVGRGDPETENVEDAVCITWSAHYAIQKRSKPFEVGISALMPLMRAQAHSVATSKHALEKICDTTAFLNPGQTPVVSADQPLYALANQIQWTWPEYGEDKCVVMFGGLHIEMSALRSLGALLQDSGWTSSLVEAGVASSGTAVFPDSIKCHRDKTSPSDYGIQSVPTNEGGI